MKLTHELIQKLNYRFNYKIIVLVLIFCLSSSCSNIFEVQNVKNLNASQLSCAGFKKNDRRSIFWSKSFPIKLYVNASFPEDKIIALTNAIYIWNTTFDSDLFNTEIGFSTSLTPTKDQKNVIYWQTNWVSTDLRNGTTLLYPESNNIIEADIILNAGNFILTADIPLSFETDLTSLLVHELGHVLGLAHLDVETSIMQTVLQAGDIRHNLSAQDIENIRCMYF